MCTSVLSLNSKSRVGTKLQSQCLPGIVKEVDIETNSNYNVSVERFFLILSYCRFSLLNYYKMIDSVNITYICSSWLLSNKIKHNLLKKNLALLTLEAFLIM